MDLSYEDQDQNKPPYEPIGFVHSYTIGGINNKKSAQTYNWQFTDILIPKTTLQQPILYYFFHTPGIYNWIRNIGVEVQSKQKIDLAHYIRSYSRKQNFGKINFSSLLDFSFDQLLSDYISKWEIVKISACCKVYVKGMIAKSSECTHLPKTTQWIKSYTHNQKNSSLIVNQVFCNQCQKQFQVDTIIEAPPFAPIFNQWNGLTIQIFKQKYNLVLAFLLKGNHLTIYIKSCNNVWYQVQKSNIQTENFVKTIGIQKIPFKQGKYFVYMKVIKSQQKDGKILRIAEPLKLKRQAGNLQKSSKLCFQQIFKPKNKLKQNQKSLQKQSKQISRIKQIYNQQLELQSLHKKMNQIIIPVQKQASLKEYSSAIQNLFNKPKQKDEYDKQYDRGKTKKIKKKKDYIKPDFNELYKRLKQQQVNKQKDQFYQQYQKEEYDKGRTEDKIEEKRNNRREIKGNGKFRNKEGFKNKKNFKDSNKNHSK